MRLLLLGGTIFLGKHLVESAARRGHEVTLFHRGEHGARRFPELEHLRGDRYGNLDSLRGRSWDAVVDTSAYFPDAVRDSAGLLAGHVGHYTFISSVSVYAGFEPPGQDESAPVARLTGEQIRAADEIPRHGQIRAARLGELYGGLKVLCEEAAEAALPGRVLHVRPGLIVGPDDGSDRFTYWVRRLDQDGEVIAPAPPGRAVQFIDVRDLAEWTLDMAEAGVTGIYNATGPAEPLQMGQVVAECASAAGRAAQVVWIPEDFLVRSEVVPWTGLPLWIGPGPDAEGFMKIDCRKAISAGLRFRPLRATVADTLAWDRGRRGEDLKTGPGAEREREILAAWRDQQKRGA